MPRKKSEGRTGAKRPIESYEHRNTMRQDIKSKERVAQFAEVLTPPEIVGAMLDLVKQETERIDSRFLEQACGTGNFLVEVLERKRREVEKHYHKVQLEYERYAVLAVSSTYSIDLLEDVLWI